MADYQYVVFKLGDGWYAGNIMNIREIIKPMAITRVPNNPSFIEGIIKLRGEVIPVLDLKKRFKLGTYDENSQHTRFIIAETDEKPIAFIVDEVREVLRLEDKDIGPIPDVVAIGKEYITGTVENNGRLVILLDMAKILTVDEREVLAAIS
ncbi:MAG: purine-binding chemotaxis protein CheW [Clostridiales bacterium]|jgi:purine-binding chemotaxis protein CheW|nr:purine-binding chemotaxis protein CheW [Clostridiales bacterium]